MRLYHLPLLLCVVLSSQVAHSSQTPQNPSPNVNETKSTEKIETPSQEVLSKDALSEMLNQENSNKESTNQALPEHILSPVSAHATIPHEESYANATTITAQSIAKRQATSLRDVFALDSSVSVGGANTTSQKLYIRGLEDRLYGVNIDGASQYGNLFHHQGNITIDPFMIKSISVQKGVPDAYMGALSLGGSLSIETKDARDFLREGQKYGALVGLGGYSNQGYRANMAGYFATKHTDGLLYVNQTNILRFFDGNGVRVEGSANNNKSLLFKLNQRIGEQNLLSLSYSGLNETSTAPFATNLAEKNVALFAHTNYNHTANLSFTHTPKSTPAPQVKSNLYFNQRSLYLKPLGENLGSEHEEVSAKNIAFTNIGYNLGLNHEFSSVDLSYGLNYQHIFVADSAAPRDPINRAKESGDVYGGFVKASYIPSAQWILAAQTRYDVFSYTDKNSTNHLTQGFSPAASITYMPLRALAFRLGYAYLTRGALPGDATLLGESAVLVDKHLRAESIQNIELNADYHGKIVHARLSAYYSHLAHFINSYAHDHDHDHDHGAHDPNQPHTHGGLRQNMDSPIAIYGYEGGVGAEYKGFSAYGSLAQSFPTYKGYLLQDTYELGAVSGVIYNLSLQYELPRFHLSFAWLSQFTQRVKYKGYDIYNDETGMIDKRGYSVHNLYVNWEPLGEKRLALRLSVNNIFNTFYIAQTSPFKNEAMESLADSSVRRAMPNPGIDARFEVSYQF